jgi:alpha-mannosidase
MTDEPRIIAVVSHTHWDREWYLPYQSFRLRLVGLLDDLLDLFDREPEYRRFMLDGHTIPLEDYLEVRPERRRDLERAIREGRLLVGPWYIIPDEFLPGGEALVRNIVRGHRVAAQFGPVMKVGYIPDPFGQIAYMPAIFRGFGIDRATMWRGADASLRHTEFIWRSPDGSEVFTIHKPGGYGIGAHLPLARDALLERIRRIRAELEPRATTRYVLLMNGSDHLPAQQELPRIIRTANEALQDARLVHLSLPEVFDGVERELNGRRDTLLVHEGEFRSGQRAHLLPGVLSARMWIKQRNQRCEDLLTLWAEPLSTWMSLLRGRVPPEWKEPLPARFAHMPFPTRPASIKALLDRAWRYLFENQPHDSICGCSVDQVHEEMATRYDEAEQIGEELAAHAMRFLAALAPPGEQVVVFNPQFGPRTDVVQFTARLREGQAPVALVAPDGSRTPAQALGSPVRRTFGPYGFDEVDVAFVARDVPGYGFRSFGIEYGPPPLIAEPSPASVIENGLLRVAASPEDGSLTVEDLRTARVWPGLNRFADGGDRGDEYNHCVPEEDRIVDRPAAPPRIELIEAGPARWTLRIESLYRLPAALAPDRRSRSAETVDVPVRTFVSLTGGVPRVDIRVEVDNTARDHRLRTLFPTGIRTDVAFADQHFGVIRRAIALPEWDPATWSEQPVGTQPQKAFVDVNDGTHGLMIANRGLPEYEVIDGADGVIIALTLLRCVGWLSRSDLTSRRGGAGPEVETPGAQMLGQWTFDYAIIPHEGGWEQGYRQAHWFRVPMRARWSQGGTGTLPAEASLLDVRGDGLVVTTVKAAEDGDGVVVRLYNTLDVETSGAVGLNDPYDEAWFVSMNEEPLRHAAGPGEPARLDLRRNEIVTLKFYQRPFGGGSDG